MFIKKLNIGLIILWIFIMSTSPFIFSNLGLYPDKILFGMLLAIMIISLIADKNIEISDIYLLIVIYLQALYFFILFIIWDQELSYLQTSIQFITCAILYLFITKYIGFEKTIKSFLLLITAMSVLAVIAFFLALLGWLQPTFLYDRNADEKIYSYILTFTNVVYFFNGFEFIRPSGFFTEGGELAFFITHAFLINKISINNKWVEILLIVSGIFTLSLAFYLSMALYYLFFFLNKKNLYKVIIIVSIIIIVFWALSILKNYSSPVKTFYYLTIDRFSISGNSGQLIKGNNRTSIISQGIEYFYINPIFGSGFSYTWNNFPLAIASIMGPLISFGIVGTFFLFLHVIYLSIISVIKIKCANINLDFVKIAIILLPSLCKLLSKRYFIIIPDKLTFRNY